MDIDQANDHHINGRPMQGIGVAVNQVIAPVPDNPPIRLPAPAEVRIVAPPPPIQIMVRSDQQNRNDARVSSLRVEVVAPSVVPPVPTPTPALEPNPAPVAAQTPAPVAVQTPALALAPNPAPSAAQTPAPSEAQTPAPATAETPSPAAASTPAPAQAPTPSPAAAQIPAPALAPNPEPSSLRENFNASQDDSLTDPAEEDDVSSMTSENTSTTTSDTSEEDNIPLSFFNPARFRKNAPLLVGPLGRQVLRPTATRRFEGRPPRSQPIQIPVPTRLLPRAEDRSTDDESTVSDAEPTSSKRRRSDRRPQ